MCSISRNRGHGKLSPGRPAEKTHIRTGDWAFSVHWNTFMPR
jgi:hypothetical protein